MTSQLGRFGLPQVRLLSGERILNHFDSFDVILPGKLDGQMNEHVYKQKIEKKKTNNREYSTSYTLSFEISVPDPTVIKLLWKKPKPCSL